MKTLKHPSATFMDDSDAERVVNLWNATRHLTNKDLKKLCKLLIKEREEMEKWEE